MILSIFFLAFLLRVLSSHAALETYVVFMDKAKMEALDVSLGTSRKWHQEIIESIHLSSTDDDVYRDQTDDYIPPSLHYVYEEVATGFSAKLSEKHLESLKRVDGFLSATRDQLRPLHTTHSPRFLGLREGKVLWSADNLASDVIIGMIDTGIWPEHPSFSPLGLPPVPTRWKGKCQASKTFPASACNRKLIGAYALFKGYEKQVHGKSVNAQFCTKRSLSRRLAKGNIVICDRGGENSRVGKGEEVKRVGGAAMILANRQTQGEEVLADPHVLPAVSLGASAATTLRDYIKFSKNPTATIEFQGQAYNNRAPVMAAFSSRGPNSIDAYILKPDVTAPGVNILAAWPANISPSGLKTDKRRAHFNLLSGTSMSCPHVSGLLALLKSRHRDWSPAALRSALMTTAYVRDSKGLPISDVASGRSKPATPFTFGSGHVDPERASDPGLVYDISTRDYLRYLCSLNYNPTQMAIFGGACHASSGHFKPGDLNYPSFSVVFRIKDSDSMVTYKRTVTNVGIPVSTYSVKVIEPEAVSITVTPSVLKFRKAGEKLCYNVIFKAKRGEKMSAGFSSFGSLDWVSGKYSVRSPIAATWIT